MGGKRKIDPATGKNIKTPSDFKKRKRKHRTTEQNAARNQKEEDTPVRIRPNNHIKVYF